MRSLNDLRRIIDAIPRSALAGIGVLVATGALFVLSVVFLGGARDAALAQGRRLQTQIDTTTKAVTQAKRDQEYVEANAARYEELIKSDKLIPHTRRAALAALRDAAVPLGLEKSLDYSFKAASTASLESAQSQPVSGAYRVSLESISLKISAPADGPIYRLLDDINRSFPGAVALESMTLTRVPKVTETELSEVSRGGGKLVVGEILLSWRTAQKEEESAETAATRAKPAGASR